MIPRSALFKQLYNPAVLSIFERSYTLVRKRILISSLIIKIKELTAT